VTGWRGGCSGNWTCTPPNGSSTMTGPFAAIATYSVAITGNGTGSGSVSTGGVNPAIDCAITAGVATGTCNATLPSPRVITLTATPGAASNVGSWIGVCGSGAGSTCTLGNITGVVGATVAFGGGGPRTVTIAGFGAGS